MARRNRSSPLEGVMDLVALLPWWAGVALALLGYLLLSQLAAAWAQPVVARPGQMGALVQGALLGALATFGQYVVPVVCLAGAALSAWRRHQRRALVDAVTHAPAAGTIDGMSWSEFEMLVGEAYRLQGFQVTETGGGPDGGVDLVLTRGGETFLVQCKQWKAFKVGVDTVRELYGVMAARGATGGFVVTSGRFTNEARLFTQGRNLQLVDGPRLLAMLQQAQQSRSAVAAVIAAHGGVHHAPAVAPEAAPARPAMPAAASAPAAASQPGCPKCGCGMVRRIARTGSNAGGAFWGCSSFPACRGVRQVD